MSLIIKEIERIRKRKLIFFWFNFIAITIGACSFYLIFYPTNSVTHKATVINFFGTNKFTNYINVKLDSGDYTTATLNMHLLVKAGDKVTVLETTKAFVFTTFSILGINEKQKI